jgi:EmrB/QacA subfamily drug resistance transporter
MAAGKLAAMTTSQTSAALAGRAPAVPSTPTRSKWAPLPVLLAGAFMVVLDFFIVNVALPSMATGLGASESSLEWVVAGYGLAFAAFLITSGRLGDSFGRRKVYAVGLVLFTATSLACGLAPSPTTLVLARVAQGVAGAVVMPQVLSIIGVTYRGEDYTRALSFYGMALGLAAVGGQLIGGALVQTDLLGLGWRGCFLINVPIGLVTLALIPRRVDESRAPGRVTIDWVGSATLALGLVAVLLPLIEGRQHGWPTWTWVSFGAAVVILADFVYQQAKLTRRGEGALLDLGLFKERAFSAGLATQLFLAGAQASFFVYLALYLQQGRGLNPLEAGLVFTILAVAYVVASGPAPDLTARYGRAVVAAGGASLALGLCLFALAVHQIGVTGSILELLPGLILVGAGIGLCFTPLSSSVLGSIDPARIGAASGTLSTTQQVGFALGVAITGVIFFGAGADIGHAFEISLIQLSALAIGIMLMTRLLPMSPRERSGRSESEAAASARAATR